MPRIPPIAASITFTVDIRCSERKSVGEEEVVVDTTRDSWNVVRERIREHLNNPEKDYQSKVVFDIDQDVQKILLRPSVRASFVKHRRVNVDDFLGQLGEIWRNAHKGGKLASGWTWVIVLMGTKPDSRRVAQRTTQNMLSEAAEVVSQRLQESKQEAGTVERSYLAHTVARLNPADRPQGVDAALANPTEAHLQIQRLDTMRRVQSERSNIAEEEEYVDVTIRIPVRRLRFILGLPEYPLIRTMGDERNIPVNLPTSITNPNQPDINHQDNE
jgi:hypothetical protein